MRIWMGLAAALLILPLGGCTDHGPLVAPTTSPTPAHPGGPFLRASNATGCTRTFPAIFVDRVHAQTFLPKGVVAAESSRFFGQPSAPAGKAVLVVSMMRCVSSEWQGGNQGEATAGIFIEPPSIRGVRQPGEHFYELGRAMTNATVRQELAKLDWPLFGEAVAVSTVAMPQRSGTGTVSDENGTVFSAIVAEAPAEDVFSGTLHVTWWNQGHDGLGRAESTMTPQGFLGQGICSARAGSVPALVMESTACPSGALVMVGPPFEVAARLVFEPGSRFDT